MLQKNCLYINIRQAPFLTIVVPSLILASTKIRSPHPQQNKRFESWAAAPFNNITIWPIISRWPDQHPLPEKLPASMPASAKHVRLQVIQRRKTRGKKSSSSVVFCWGVPGVPRNFRVFLESSRQKVLRNDWCRMMITGKQNSVFFLPKPAWFSEGDGTNHVSRNFPIRSQWSHHFLRVAMAFLEQEGYSSRQ